MARFRKFRNRFSSFRNRFSSFRNRFSSFRKRRRSRSRKVKLMKKKIFGIPVIAIVMFPILLYFFVPSVKNFINEKIFKKS